MNVAVIPSVARPTAGAWYEGSDLGGLAAAAGIIEACFYEPGAARVKADLFDVKRRLGGRGKLRGILRPAHPDFARRGEFLAAAEALADDGVDGIAFYNWGHLRDANVAWIGEALRLLERRRDLLGQGRGDHRCGRRHRPGAVPVFRSHGAAVAAIDKDADVESFAEELGRRRPARPPMRSPMSATARRWPAAFDDLAARLGPVDILVNNAGFSEHPTFADTDPAAWRHDVNGNLNGAYYCAHAVPPAMKAKASGSIIAIGSVNGIGALGDPAYSAAKAGMISLTRSLALEYGRFGIRANIVLPGHRTNSVVGAPRRQRPGGPGAARPLVSARPHRRSDRCGERGRFSGIRCRRGDHRSSTSGRLRTVGRQHRHGARADAAGFLSGKRSLATMKGE